MNHDIKAKVIDMLKQKSAYHMSINGKQHYTRCPYCGDSRNLAHAHLSIHIDIFSDTPMMYRCLKCDVRGLVTDNVLIELDLPIDSTMIKELKCYNRKAIKVSKLVNLDFESYTVPLYTDSCKNQMKLDYLNNRLGINIDIQEAKDKKIILNLFDFMVLNEIKMIDGLTYNMMKMLDNDYIGFLSTNNNCIVFRDITGNNKLRYYKVILNTKNVNPDTFYGIPGSISMLYTHDINIHMAEGVFDILSIEKNLPHNKAEHNLFYATCGYGGVTLLKYLLHHGINTGINLHIYSDKDKADWNHKKYLFNNSGTAWIDHIYIHRNQRDGEKDYGVPLSRIADSYRKIK